jgi:4-hydroxy-4-methyl-2-oxoglutarate aldolase
MAEEGEMIRINNSFERPALAEIQALAAHSSATVHEAQGRRGALSSRLKPIDPAMSLCGPAFTVQGSPRDNLMLQIAIAYAKPGDVIVFATGGYEEAGCFGDVLGNAAQSRGLGGLVVDTGVRDTASLRQLGFPVFSLSVCIKGTNKFHQGNFNQPVVIGDEIINPGDIVRGDVDGLVVVRRHEAANIARLSAEREAIEEVDIKKYRSGKSVLELSPPVAELVAKGLIIED